MAERRQTTAQDLLKRWDAMIAQRDTVDVRAQEIADYILPHKAVITQQATEGQKLTSFLFDGEGPWAAAMLARTLAGAMTSAAQQFFNLSLEPEDLREDKETQDWLEDCAERIYAALGRSNFHAENLEQFTDAVTFATATLFIEEAPPLVTGEFGGLLFTAIPFQERCISQNAEGLVDTLFRRFKLSARAAYGKWKERAGPRVVAAATEQHKNQEEEFEFLHAIYPRMYRDRHQHGTAANMPWCSYYVSIADKTIIEESGYQEFPAPTWRWDKIPGLIYGFGPSHMALPDVKTVNVTKELLLKAAALKIQPPTVEKNDSVVGDVDRNPGGRNVAEDPTDLQFLDTKADVRLGELVIQDLHASIDKCYYIQELRLKESPAMTATEVLAKREELERLLGPTAGRIESEYLTPLLLRVFAIMFRANAFAPMPDAVQHWMGQRRGLQPMLDLRYEGPLQRARRAADRVAIQAFYQMLGIASQFDAGAKYVLKHQDALREYGELSGVPSKLLNDEKAVMALLQAEQQAKDKAAQTELMLKSAEALGKAGPGIRELTRAVPGASGGVPPTNQPVAA